MFPHIVWSLDQDRTVVPLQPHARVEALREHALWSFDRHRVVIGDVDLDRGRDGYWHVSNS